MTVTVTGVTPPEAPPPSTTDQGSGWYTSSLYERTDSNRSINSRPLSPEGSKPRTPPEGWWWHTREIVDTLPLFRRLTDAQRQALCDQLWGIGLKKVPKGDVILQYQQEMKGMYIIGEGKVQASRGTGAARERAQFQAGDVFGVSAFLGKMSASDAKYIADADTVKLLILTREIFETAVGSLDMLLSAYLPPPPSPPPSETSKPPTPDSSKGITHAAWNADKSQVNKCHSDRSQIDKCHIDKSQGGIWRNMKQTWNVMMRGVFGGKSQQPPAPASTDVSPIPSPRQSFSEERQDNVGPLPGPKTTLQFEVDMDNRVLSLEDIDVSTKVLGEGATASVYEGIICHTRHPCAVKIMSLSKLQNSRALDYINKEMKTMEEVMSPGCSFIIKCFGTFKTPWSNYIVQELGTGGTLEKYMDEWERKQISPNVNTIRIYTAQVLVALEYLHGWHNIMYRDLKPANLITFKGCRLLKLTDLGFAKRLRGCSDLNELKMNSISTKLPGLIRGPSDQNLQHLSPSPSSSQDHFNPKMTRTPSNEALNKLVVGSSLYARTASDPDLSRLVVSGSPGTQSPLAHTPTRRISDGRPKLEPLGADSGQYEARAFSGAGTTHYAAPEIINGSGCSFPADTWSLGVLMYHLFMGHTPFDIPKGGKVSTEDEVMYNITHNHRNNAPFRGPESANTLVNDILIHDESNRLPLSRIRHQSFLQVVKWETLLTEALAQHPA